MADYISREAAIKKFCDDCMDREWCNSNGESCSRIKNINAVPAADVVEVVWCGNCEHWRGPNQICRGIGVDFDANGFCSYGERKMNNGN